MASTTEPLAPELLALLRCPETMQNVSLAPPEVLARLNQALGSPLEQGLMRADGALVFPIRDGIPLLLMSEAIAVPPI